MSSSEDSSFSLASPALEGPRRTNLKRSPTRLRDWRITWALERVLLAGVMIVAVGVVRDFVRYADHYPYMAADDALANVSYAFATEGRYDFVARPLQGYTTAYRHRGFVNHGPWYYYLAAALIWLFGYNLPMLRAIHLAGILAIAAAGCRWFGRRVSVVPGAVLSLGLLYCFNTGQWPMVRPDIAVSLFAVAFIVAAGRAIETGSAIWWFCAGVAAGCAALSHLIAWALVVSCGLSLGVALLSERPTRSRAKVLVLAAAGGLIGAAVMFYAGIGFRFRDQFLALAGYGQFLSVNGQVKAMGYSDVLRTHLAIGFSHLRPLSRALLVLPVVAACVWLVASCWRPVGTRRRTLAWLLPPLAVLACYVLSLGTYPNFHQGYAILTQVVSLWCAASVVAMILSSVTESSPLAAAIVRSLAAMLLVIVAGFQAWNRPGAGDRLRLVTEWVGIRDFTDRVHELIPTGSTAWGDITLGIENPGRVQLAQLQEGLLLVERPTRRPMETFAIAPAYLAWGYSNNRDHILDVLGSRLDPHLSTFVRLERALPGVTYRLIGLVAARPYGVTRIYSKGIATARPPADLPTVSVYDAARGLWDRRLDGPLAHRFQPTAPATIGVGYGPTTPRAADRTLAASIPAGRFLLRIRVGSSSNATKRMLAVTRSPSMEETISDLGPTADMSPYGERDGVAYLFCDHPGGPLYVSQFDDGEGANLDAVEVYRIRPLLHDGQAPEPERLIFSAMPPLRDWLPSRGIQAHLTASGGLAVDGDASRLGYQVASPPVRVGPSARVTVRTAFASEQGSVCVGALNGSGAKWLANGGIPSGDYTFTADETAAFRFVFYNCHPTGTEHPRSRFTVSNAYYSVKEDGRSYFDQLTSLQ